MSNPNPPIVTLEKASGRAICRGPECKKDKKFLTESGRIVKNTTCAAISINPGSTIQTLYRHYFCYDCMSWLLIEFKKVLDPTFRAFL